jgi:hypothetical protein
MDELEEMKKTRPKIYRPWSADDDRRLAELYNQKTPARMIAIRLRRSTQAVRHRITQLKLAKPIGSA